MKTLMLIFVLLLLLVSGCSSTNITELITAAGKDSATVCAAAMYAGANLNFVRTNCTNCEMDCNNGHLTIKSQPPAMPVGVQLVPMTQP